MSYFDHEKLDVYKASVEFVVLANTIIQKFPKGYSHLSEQLQRASTSISLNTAEGAGEHSYNEKQRFYLMAKRSGTECAAIFDICKSLLLIDENDYESARKLLLRVTAMLTKLSSREVAGLRKNSVTGTVTVTGTKDRVDKDLKKNSVMCMKSHNGAFHV